ncbi:MAG TPA: ABC transporter permease, partial [Alphaproteobacteria bacterium]|nr:ABC transporter permease [Alphaproteobacteria bacterium]
MSLFGKASRKDRELDEEIRSHMEMARRDRMAQGESAAEADAAVRREFGNVSLVKEVTREIWGWASVERLAQDVRYALRTLCHKPGFAVITLLTLALGIGANTAIFSVINAALLRPLPFRDSNRLVFLWATTPDGCAECWHGVQSLSDPNFLDIREQNTVFESMGVFGGQGFTLTGMDNPQFLKAGRVTAGYFEVLGIQPLLGRTFIAEDEKIGRDHVVLLSYNLWRQRFAADQKIVGATIHLDTIPYTVLGVLPAGSDLILPGHYGARDLWVPVKLSRDAPRGSSHLPVIARIRTGVTLRQAQENASLIMARIAKQYPDAANFGVKVVPAQREITGDIRPVLLVLFGAVGLVLLIACVNVAHLQLAQASGRLKEIAVRAALGASRVRIIRQLLTESILLALMGGALGTLLGAWGSGLLVGLRPAGLPQEAAITFDFRVLAYSLALSLLTGVLFGLAPAMQSITNKWNESLKSSGRTSAMGETGTRLRNFLTVAEVALSMVLLIGAGLMLRSFSKLLQVDPGFSTKNVTTLRFSLPRYSYPDGARQSGFYRQVMEQARALPGVKAVGAIDDLPLTSDKDSDRISIADHPQFNGDKNHASPQERWVTPDFFRAMSIPVMSGRTCSESDLSTGPQVIMINQTFARTYFANENPIGQRIKFGPPDSNNPWITVVGVAGDVRDNNLAINPDSEIYACYQQDTLLYNPRAHMTMVVLTAGDGKPLANALLGKIRELDGNLPLPTVLPMEAVYAESIAARRFNMLLLSIFAVMAMTLAAIGIYGVISYSVVRRTQ